jgi:hypothetical protein
MVTHADITDYRLPGLLHDNYHMRVDPATYAITLHSSEGVIRVHFDHLSFLVVNALLEAYPCSLPLATYHTILLARLHTRALAHKSQGPLIACCSEILRDAFGLIIASREGWYRLAMYEEVRDDRL